MPWLPNRLLPEKVTHTLEAVGRALRDNGAGFVVWTVLIGVGLAIAVLGALDPGGPFPHHFPLWGHPVIASLVATALVAGIAAGVAFLRRGRARSFARLYAQNVRRAAPLSMMPFLLVLSEPIETTHAGIVLALAALAGALTAYAAYDFGGREEPVATGANRPSGVRRRIAPWTAPVALGVAMLAYAFLASRITVTNHLALNTGRSDLGYYLSVFRESSQGKLLGCSLCGGGSHLTGHFDPILVLLSPLFLLYPFAETLLVLQTLWLCSGAIPVYRLARHHIEHRGASLALAVVYLAYPALHGVNFFDFHSIALCIPLFLWLLYFLERGTRLGYYAVLALLLLVREDIPIALVFVGIYAIFSRVPERARMGYVTIAVSIFYFVTAKAMFMGRVDPLNTSTGAPGGYAYYYEALVPVGHSTGALVGTLLSNPVFVLSHVLTDEKIDFVLKLLVPLFALPLAARGRMMLAYGSALTLLASRVYLFSIHFQYTSLLIPFLFALAISALGRLKSEEAPFGRASGPRLSRALPFGMLVTTLICSWKFGGIIENASFQGGFRPLVREADSYNRASAAWLKKVALKMPRGSRVAGNSRLITHLGPVTYLDLLEHRTKADYVVANISSRPLGVRILAEETAGSLKLLDSYNQLRFYKTQYDKHAVKEAPAEPAEL